MSAMLEATWLLFIVASLVLITTPGQDMILVMSRSVAQGAAAGWPRRPGSASGWSGTRCWPRWGWVHAAAHVEPGPSWR
jgi:hypothetical protein